MVLFFITPVKRWINYATESKEASNLKILTFNVKGGNFGKEKIEEYINSQNADLVFIQEDPENKLELRNLKQLKNLPVLTFYSKYKIISQKNLFEELEDRDITTQTEQIDVEIRGKIYRIINVHLESFGLVKSMVKLNGKSDEDEEKVKNVVKRLIPTFKKHQEQIDIVQKSIEDSPYPVILAGDFNSVPNSYEYFQVAKHLNDAFLEVGKGSGTSFHDYKYPLRIDYIFSSESIKPVSYKVDHSVHLSDHFPVIATFKID